jgi:hypothetical protein
LECLYSNNEATRLRLLRNGVWKNGAGRRACASRVPEFETDAVMHHDRSGKITLRSQSRSRARLLDRTLARFECGIERRAVATFVQRVQPKATGHRCDVRRDDAKKSVHAPSAAHGFALIRQKIAAGSSRIA